MNIIEIRAWEKAFPILKNIEVCTTNPALEKIEVGEYTEKILTTQFFSKMSREEHWDGPAGDPYDETTIAILFERKGENRSWIIPENTSIIEELADIYNDIKLLNIVKIHQTGGNDIIENQNEFGYGSKIEITVYDCSSKPDLLRVVSEREFDRAIKKIEQQKG